MDVADQLQEIRIFFADDGFVAILEKVATTFVSFVEGDGVSGHHSAHDFAEWGRARPASRGISRGGRAGAQKDVKVVGDQSPSIALGLGLLKDQGQTFKKGSAILIIPKDFSAFDPPGHYMLKDTGSV